MALELVLLDGAGAGIRLRLGDSAVTIGRAPVNNLVVPDASVSWMHCLAWEEAGRVLVRDLGSANGTFVGERRVAGVEELLPGVELRLGHDTRLVLEGNPRPADRSVPVVAHVESGARIPVFGDRLHFGGGHGVDVPIPGAEGRVATLLVDPDGRCWLGRGDEDALVDEGAVFEVGGWSFRLESVPATGAPTMRPQHQAYPYALRARLDGPHGPEAVLTDLERGVEHRVESSTKSVLLLLLARKLAGDRAERLPTPDQGWCATGALQSGIWGRQGNDNRLDVLVCRVRADLRAQGFDAWAIERRQGHLRQRVAEVLVD